MRKAPHALLCESAQPQPTSPHPMSGPHHGTTIATPHARRLTQARGRPPSQPLPPGRSRPSARDQAARRGAAHGPRTISPGSAARPPAEAATSHPARAAPRRAGSEAGERPAGNGDGSGWKASRARTYPDLMAPDAGKEEARLPHPLAAGPRFRRRPRRLTGNVVP